MITDVEILPVIVSNRFGHLPAEMQIRRADELAEGMTVVAQTDVCASGLILESPGADWKIQAVRRGDDWVRLYSEGWFPQQPTVPNWLYGVLASS